jgi:hypothetical protein
VRAAGLLLYAGAALSGIAAAMAAAVGLDWIEQLTGSSPDGGDGRLEIAWVVGPILVAALCAGAGHRLRSARH